MNLDARGLPEGYRLRSGLEVTPREARAAHERGEISIIDCRTPEEFEIARVQGTELIPLAELEDRMDEIDTSRPIAFLCHHGVRSLKAALAARAAGITGAVSIAGGIELWSISTDPSVPRYERGPGGCTLVP